MYEKFTTYELTQFAYRVTPRAELTGWIATSEAAADCTEAELRVHVTEQLECLGITDGDLDRMRS